MATPPRFRHTRDPAALDTVVHHDGLLTITRAQGSSQLRLAGEADLSNVQALQEALASAAEQDRGDLRLDVSELRFIDIPAARVLIEAAGTLDKTNRVVLNSPTSIVKKTLTLGWGQHDNLVLHEDPDEQL